MVEAVIRRSLGCVFSRELGVKVGYILGRGDHGQEGWGDTLVVNIVKVDVAEVRVCLDLLRISWSCSKTQVRNLHQQLLECSQKGKKCQEFANVTYDSAW